MNKINIILKETGANLRSHIPKIFERPFFMDRYVQVVLGVSGLLFAATWIIALVRFRPSDFLVPVRYNSFLGVTQLGNWYGLYQVPLIMTLCLILNILLGNVIYKKDKMIGYIFAASGIFITVVALVITINFSILTK